MATARIAARYVSRRLSSGGKILSEEEKAAENVFIKKTEQEKLEKLARKGPKPGEQAPTTPEAAASDVKLSGPASSFSTGGASTNKNRNYAVVAGTVAAASIIGWWFLSRPKKSEEIVDQERE